MPTLQIAALAPANPPTLHYRVLALGTAHKDGSRYGVLQIDYLTVWNKDDGLQTDVTCEIALGLLGLSLDGLGSHPFDDPFDEERSAVLVAAPVANTASGSPYAMAPGSYKAYAYYLAAHENVLPFDHSGYLIPRQPLDGGIDLWLSRGKHSTYFFNPNKFPIFRQEIITAVYATIAALLAAGKIDETQYAILVAAADLVFFGCVVERFQEQGAALPTNRINVGELARPLLQALHEFPQFGCVQLHNALCHRGRRRLLAGHQPRAQVVRQREQLPHLQGGDLRHHRLQRERVQAPARGLFQQGAEPVQRARGCVPRGAGFNPNRPSRR